MKKNTTKTKITQVGHPLLRLRAKRVRVFASPLRKLITRMTEVMRTEGLVGIAAPQIGSSTQVFITEIRKTKSRPKLSHDSLRIFINPSIVEMPKRQKPLYEGCGSVLCGALFAAVPRASWVKLRYQDAEGVVHVERFEGLLAHIIQHEVDHLHGTLFLDRVVDTETYITREQFRHQTQ
ncbi:MAG: hypothetical protein RI911_264 [Candidatus Parcubacteria bacterium]|jgi:peptide deformylase